MSKENCGCKKGPKPCYDVCTKPLCGTPPAIGIMTPVIYDEIGVNLCATFNLGTLTPTDLLANATSATVKLIGLNYAMSGTDVAVSRINGRPNCYLVTLRNIVTKFEINFYDENCKYITTLLRERTYLTPPGAGSAYDEDTNPSSVQLEIFAPYGVAYQNAMTESASMVINKVSLDNQNGTINQGINLYAIPKLLDFDNTTNNFSVGLTLVLQSVYYAGYKVPTLGKVKTPKGSLVPDTGSDCIKFVEGGLLNLDIRPLDLGAPMHQEKLKNDCSKDCINDCTEICPMSCDNNSNCHSALKEQENHLL